MSNVRCKGCGEEFDRGPHICKTDWKGDPIEPTNTPALEERLSEVINNFSVFTTGNKVIEADPKYAIEYAKRELPKLLAEARLEAKTEAAVELREHFSKSPARIISRLVVANVNDYIEKNEAELTRVRALAQDKEGKDVSNT